MTPGKYPPRPVLISGCSSGIGAATAAASSGPGTPSTRRPDRSKRFADLKTLGCHPLALDVTSEDSIIAAVGTVEAEHGQVGTLVNNAGFAEYGPIEESDLVRCGHVRDQRVRARPLTQLVLPAMRRSRSGRIVNIGSMAGRFTFPVGGFYHAPSTR